MGSEVDFRSFYIVEYLKLTENVSDVIFRCLVTSKNKAIDINWREVEDQRHHLGDSNFSTVCARLRQLHVQCKQKRISIDLRRKATLLLHRKSQNENSNM
jgi:hypothetical protein